MIQLLLITFRLPAYFNKLPTAKNLKKIKFRDFSEENIASFLEQAPNEPNLPTVINAENINTLHDELFARLKVSLNAFFSIREKTISLKKLKSPWFTKPILRCIEKNIGFLGSLNVAQYFSTYKNKLRRLLVLAKKYYFSKHFTEARNNIQKTWKIRSNSKITK